MAQSVAIQSSAGSGDKLLINDDFLFIPITQPPVERHV